LKGTAEIESGSKGFFKAQIFKACIRIDIGYSFYSYPEPLKHRNSVYE